MEVVDDDSSIWKTSFGYAVNGVVEVCGNIKCVYHLDDKLYDANFSVFDNGYYSTLPAFPSLLNRMM